MPRFKIDCFIEMDEDRDRFPIRQIKRFEELGTGDVSFEGTTTAQISTPAGKQELPIRFDILDKCKVDEAFEAFEKNASLEVERITDEIQSYMVQISRLEKSENSFEEENLKNLGNVIDMGIK